MNGGADVAPVGALVVPVSADIKGLKSGLESAKGSLKGFAKDVRREAKDLSRIQGLFADVSNLGGLMGFAVGGAVGGAVGTVAGQLAEGIAKETGLLKAVGKEYVKFKDDFRILFGMDTEKQLAAKEDFKKQSELLGEKINVNDLGHVRAQAMARQRQGWNAKEIEQMSEMERLAESISKLRSTEKEAQAARLDMLRFGMDPIDRAVAEAKDRGMNVPNAAIFREALEKKRDFGLQEQGQRRNFQMLLERDREGKQNRMENDALLRQERDVMAGRIQGEFERQQDAAARPVEAMRKGSAAEFSALAKLRRELEKKDALTPDEIEDLRKQLEKNDGKREKQLDDIKRALKDPPIKQAVFN